VKNAVQEEEIENYKFLQLESQKRDPRKKARISRSGERA
jgi:hypothetical protein